MDQPAPVAATSWCLQEGAAAGVFYAMFDGKLVSIRDVAIAENERLCELDISLSYQPGNAAEIIARMDMRTISRKDGVSYALTGILSIHLVQVL